MWVLHLTLARISGSQDPLNETAVLLLNFLLQSSCVAPSDPGPDFGFPRPPHRDSCSITKLFTTELMWVLHLTLARILGSQDPLTETAVLLLNVLL